MWRCTPTPPPVPNHSPAHHVLVVAGGPPPATAHHDWIHASIGEPDRIVAADSGFDNALALGLNVTVLVGDLDSISGTGLEHARAHDVAIHEFPPDKDFTDLELAIETALDLGATHITVLDSGAGRFDHVMSNVLLMTSDRWAALESLRAIVSDCVLTISRSGTVFVYGAPGDTVTLLAATEKVDGITTTNLEYPLANDQLTYGQTRGVSNVITASPATVSHSTGVLLIFQPRADLIAK